MGSSYSAALGLKVAKENPNVKAVLSFSPGEYFGNKLALGKTIAGLDKPTFITSSKSEVPTAKPLADVVAKDAKSHILYLLLMVRMAQEYFGQQQPFSDEYWAAVNAFLEQHNL